MTEFAKVLLVAIFISPAFAVATEDVGDSLRMDLHRLTKETHRQTVSYNNARKFIIGYLHTEPSTNGNYYVIRDVYCQDEHMTRGPREGASGMNVEHTWPQSHFFGGATQLRMKSDLHHLFPTKTRINAERGNLKFGPINGRKMAISCEASTKGEGVDGSPRFEPPHAHKGNVARALFYFAVRYGGRIDTDEEAALREWNHLDPVDEAEMKRNDEIERLQGNRNPFIDHPEYADSIPNF